jgi:hypothetical protein
VSEPTQPPLPEPRASDAERERAVARLGRAAADGRLDVDELEERVALAYATRTRRELERLVADLPEEDVHAEAVPTTSVAPARAHEGAVLREGPGGTGWVVSVLGGSDRKGRWRVAARCTVVNVLGGSDLDLCDAELAAPITQINVYTVMGGADIRVPHGVDVQVTKFALMGGHDVELGDELPPPGAPLIRIRLLTLMGGCDVKRGRKRSRRDRRRERALDKAGKREVHRGDNAGELDP